MRCRNFLKTLIGGIAATAAVRTWPFRVYSFPSEIKLGDIVGSNVIIRIPSRFAINPERNIPLRYYSVNIPFTARELGIFEADRLAKEMDLEQGIISGAMFQED